MDIPKTEKLEESKNMFTSVICLVNVVFAAACIGVVGGEIKYKNSYPETIGAGSYYFVFLSSTEILEKARGSDSLKFGTVIGKKLILSKAILPSDILQ